MSSGIRATVAFQTPDICPIVGISASEEATIDSVDTNVCPADCSTSVSEFSVDGADDLEVDPDADLTSVFEHGSTRRYRIAHDEGIDCPCECLGRFGCPVARYVARDGTLTLVFHAADYEELRDVVGELRDRFPDVDIERFVRSPTTDRPDSTDEAFVDRSKLTSRQLEVLETAFEMGYFDRPRRANATEVATALDIDPSTFREHLGAAQEKVFEDLV